MDWSLRLKSRMGVPMFTYQCAECGKTFTKARRSKSAVKAFCSNRCSILHRRAARNSPERRAATARRQKAVLTMLRARKQELIRSRDDGPDYNVG